LLGLNPPLGHAVQVIEHAPAEKKTTTEGLRDILDNVLGIAFRERQLLDRRELNGDDSAETLTEINELRTARGKPPAGRSMGARRRLFTLALCEGNSPGYLSIRSPSSL